MVGRPLWTTTGEDPVLLAINKLTKDQENKKELFALAVFLSRVGLSLNQAHPSTSKLVANHMATLLAADNSQEGLLVTYVSDPVLSKGARLKWQEDGYAVKQMLPAMRRALVQGQVMKGQLGEIVGATITLMAIDFVCTEEKLKVAEGNLQRSKEVHWVTVRAFLLYLIGTQNDQRLSAQIEELMGGCSDAFVCVNHFIQWYQDLLPKDLELLCMR